MSKFYGIVGFSVMQESNPGVWSDDPVERYYGGNTLNNKSVLTDVNQINDNLICENSISILADKFAMDNFQSIKYVKFAGGSWKVRTVQKQYSRIIMTLGGVYAG